MLTFAQYTNPGFSLPSLKGAWDLVYPGRNCDVREILGNLIGCLEDYELKKTDKSRKMKTRIDGYNMDIFFSL